MNIAQDGQGHLVFRATKNASGGYDSARIKTQGRFSFTYGRVEARMKLPRGPGMWPAFWMLGDAIKNVGWPKCGEIDVMENIGREPRIVHGTVHGPRYSAAHGISAPFTFPEDELPSDGFHVYAVNWTPAKIEFMVDGNVYHTVTPQLLSPSAQWVFNRPFFLLLNLAVGGRWPGNPDESTRFPQEFTVDWVRVYQE